MKFSSAMVVLLACSSALYSSLSSAEPLTSQQGDVIINELREIKTLLQTMARRDTAKPTRQRPTKARVNTAGGYSLGNKDAPLTIVEFTDFQCPFCRRFHEVVFPELKKKYIDAGILRYVSHDLPLSMHANALMAANAGRCAGEQNKFWQMRDVMFAKAPKLTQGALIGYAKDLSLDMSRFRQCLDSKKYSHDITKDINDAHVAGFTGTPSFVLGKTLSNGFVDGEAIIGAKPFPYIEDKIKALLSQK